MSSFSKPSLFATTTEQALSPTTFSAVTIISIGLLIARINVYAINAGSLAYPIPDRIVNKTTAPAPGAAGVPTLATNANTAIVKIDNNVTLYPPYLMVIRMMLFLFLLLIRQLLLVSLVVKLQQMN